MYSASLSTLLEISFERATGLGGSRDLVIKIICTPTGISATIAVARLFRALVPESYDHPSALLEFSPPEAP